MTNQWDGALCAQTDPELFFPAGDAWTVQIRDAKRLCAECPLTVACLKAGLEPVRDGQRTTLSVGIWGGATFSERLRMRRDTTLMKSHIIELRKKYARPARKTK